MKKNIVILDGFAANPGDLDWGIFDKLGEVTIYERTTPDEVYDRIKDAHIIFTNKIIITTELMEKCNNLEWIGVTATGYNVIDMDTATRKGIHVTNIPAYSTESVVQHVFAFILHHCNCVPLYNDKVSNGDWQASKDFCLSNFTLTEIDQRTLGIIGYGAIGQRVSQVALAFGMKVKVYTRNPNKYAELPLVKSNQIAFADFDTVLADSDFITLHCPLNDESQEIINSESLSKMKKTAFLVNTGRGPLVNESDLATALNNDLLSGAGLDVLTFEPPKDGSPLIGAKNCYITPHVAWSTKAARERLMGIAYENLRSYLEDGVVKNCVN